MTGAVRDVCGRHMAATLRQTPHPLPERWFYGQTLDKLTGAKSSFEFVPLLSDTVMGAALGAMGAVKPGVTTGNGSCLHLSKQFRTKLKNGSCHRVSYDTACKMFKGEFYDKALLPGSFASTTWAKDFGLLYAGGAGK